MLRKKGCCVWEDWRKITHFFIPLTFWKWTQREDTGCSTHFGSCKLFLEDLVAHCSSAKQLHGQICLIFSCWKRNQASPRPLACSLRKLWVRESHEPSVCTLTSLRLHQFTSSYSPNLVFLHFWTECFLTESSWAAGTISAWALSAVLAWLQPVPLVYFLNELMVLALEGFYEYWLRTWVSYSSVNLFFFWIYAFY